MRIGKFAEKFQVKVDTIRYYMEIGLLLPQKTDHYYEFDHTCEEDMELITELKRYRFSLQEIHNIISFKRVTLFTENEDLNFFIQMLNSKKEQLVAEKNSIDSAIHTIEDKVETLRHRRLEQESRSGVPLTFLSLFACPECGNDLSLKEAVIKEQQVFAGELFCTCGYKASIQDGIVLTDHLNEVSFNPHYLYDPEMFKIMDPSMIDLSEKCSLWIKKRLLSEPLKDKVIIETHVDTYVFLNKYIMEFGAETRCIFCGSTIEMLQDLKAKVEKVSPRAQALYLLNSGLDLPLKKQSIDYVIDSYSFNEYALFHNSLPMQRLAPYLNAESTLIGSSFYYPYDARSLKKMKELYPNGYESNLTPSFIEKNLWHTEFEFEAKEEIGSTMNPGGYLKYHTDGERVTFFTYELGRPKRV